MPLLDDARDLMVHAARKAGEAVMELYQGGFRTDLKEDGSPVTTADRLAESILLEALRKEYPLAGYLSEETADDKSRL